jgi:hypothetical protein
MPVTGRGRQWLSPTILYEKLPMIIDPKFSAATLVACVMLSACGGGGSSPPDVQPPPPPPGDPYAANKDAATKTAINNALCKAIAPFYFEIGDSTGALLSGSIGTKSDNTQYKSTDTMNIASSSKWLFGAYAVEVRNGVLDPVNDIALLNFTSGWSNFNNASCQNTATVAVCNNGARDTNEQANHSFHYNAGHLQTWASNNAATKGLVNATLATEVQRVLGSGVTLQYFEPQLAGGVITTPAAYAAFLRKLLGPSPALKMGTLLGSSPACTLPSVSCNASLPAVVPEAWHYSLAHWVEDDPANNPTDDYFAYSSGGALGFYPWVDKTKTLYGLIAREQIGLGGEGYDSGQCGRVIRVAWKTATAQ